MLKDIPTPQQIADEFGLTHMGVWSMKKKAKKAKKISRIMLYKKAWVLRLVLSYMTRAQFVKFEKEYPSDLLLSEYIGVTRSNISALRRNGGKIYDVYIDAWNFDKIIEKILQNT